MLFLLSVLHEYLRPTLFKSFKLYMNFITRSKNLKSSSSKATIYVVICEDERSLRSLLVKGELKAHIHIFLYESNTLQE